MKILKFGGTSVNTAERLQTLCSIVRKERHASPVVVVSALRGVTDLLLSVLHAPVSEQKSILKKIHELHTVLLNEYWDHPVPSEISAYLTQCLIEIEALLRNDRRDPEQTDLIVSFGERLSSFIVSKALEKEEIRSQQVIATTLIVTDDAFTSAEFMPEKTRRNTRRVLLPLLKKGIVPVVTGFIGATGDGRLTTLGRGGSDYTASILGYALPAAEIQIWTDVDGIYSADPRMVTEAQRIPAVTFREASELATFGAKVLHPRTIRPAVAEGIPVRVLSTKNPKSSGTIITQKEQVNHVIAVATKPNITVVNLYSTDMLLTKGFLRRIFSVFEKHEISIDVVSVSEVSVSVTLDNEERLAEAITELSTFTTVTKKQMGMLSLVGEGIVRVPHIMRDIFAVLDAAEIPVPMISLGATDINISLIVSPEHVEDAVWLLHQKVVRTLPGTERSYI